MTETTTNYLAYTALFIANVDNITPLISEFTTENNSDIAIGAAEVGCSLLALFFLAGAIKSLPRDKKFDSGFLWIGRILFFSTLLAISGGGCLIGISPQKKIGHISGVVCIMLSKFLHPSLTQWIQAPGHIKNVNDADPVSDYWKKCTDNLINGALFIANIDNITPLVSEFISSDKAEIVTAAAEISCSVLAFILFFAAVISKQFSADRRKGEYTEHSMITQGIVSLSCLMGLVGGICLLKIDNKRVTQKIFGSGLILFSKVLHPLYTQNGMGRPNFTKDLPAAAPLISPST